MGLLIGIGMLVGVIAGLFAGLVGLAWSADALWRPMGESEQAVAFELVLVVVIAALAGAAYLLFTRAKVPWGELPRPADRTVRQVAVGLTVCAGVLAFGLYGTEMARSDARQVVKDYCAYGAVSRAQLDGCVSHVSLSDVQGRHTPAARFALGSVDEVSCGADSGPFCAAVDERRVLEALEPEP